MSIFFNRCFSFRQKTKSKEIIWLSYLHSYIDEFVWRHNNCFGSENRHKSYDATIDEIANVCGPRCNTLPDLDVLKYDTKLAESEAIVDDHDGTWTVHEPKSEQEEVDEYAV